MKIVNILVITIFHIYVLVTYVFHVWLQLILTKQSRDIEQNLRPKSNFCKIKFISHWNLNCISAHNFIKISFLNINIATHKLDIICLSETILTPVFQMMMRSGNS